MNLTRMEILQIHLSFYVLGCVGTGGPGFS
jgi:hypothetical protein